jgi:hypothetical protein
MKILIFNFNCILDDVVKELSNRGHKVTEMKLSGAVDNWKKYDVIVFWNETELAGWRNLVKMAKKAKKRTILVQHGRRGTSRIYPPFNEGLLCDKVCVWGEYDKQRLMSVGTPLERIVVTGSPILNKLKPREPHKGTNIVFSPEHWGQEVDENFIVAGQLRRISGVNIITKVLEREHAQIYDNPVISNRTDSSHLDICAGVISKADLVVGISESTLELMAQTLDIPVVIAEIWKDKAGADGDERYKEYHREYSKACYREKNIFKLGDAIKYCLKHPEHLRKERAEVVIGDAGDYKNAVNNICNVICSK